MYYSRRRIQRMLDELPLSGQKRKGILSRLNERKNPDTVFAAIWEMTILRAIYLVDSNVDIYPDFSGRSPEALLRRNAEDSVSVEVKCLTKDRKGVRKYRARGLEANRAYGAISKATQQLRSKIVSKRFVILCDGGYQLFKHTNPQDALRLIDIEGLDGLRRMMNEYDERKFSRDDIAAGETIDVALIAEHYIKKSSSVDAIGWIYLLDQKSVVRSGDGCANGFGYGLRLKKPTTSVIFPIFFVV